MRKMSWVSLLLALVLVGCRLPSIVPHAPAPADAGVSQSAAPVLQGRVGASHQVQLTDLATEFAPGATVALVDSLTGYTAATSVTDMNGNFTMVFDAGFAPIDNRPYYLDAVKGIKGRGPDLNPNDQFNQAGADAMRLRTVVYHQSSPKGWTSFYNQTPGPITISRESTALALALFLKSQTTSLDLKDFLGCLETGSYVPVPGFSDQEFQSSFQIVDEAITQDRDPIQYLSFDTDNGFVNLFNSHSIATISPTSGAIDQEVAILGDGFNYPGQLTVRFNGVEAFESAPRTPTRITVRVPVGARTGPVTVQIETVIQAGPVFTINSFDGHRSMLNDVLYVANADRNEIVAVDKDGVVRSFAAVGARPSQVVLGPDNFLYVACRDANKVMKIDPSQPAPTAVDFVNTPTPTGMAFRNNILYVANRTAGTVSRFNLDGTPASAPLIRFAVPFETPSALAFDYAGNLYVAEETRGAVYRMADLTTGAGMDWSYPSSPSGLSVDSSGTLYVSSYTDDLVYRVLPTRAVSVFARIPKPAGLMLDNQGYMYVAADTQHQIYRISPLGDVKPYAYGISDPRGVAVDGLGNLYVSLSRSNAILKVERSGSTYLTRPFLRGIANPHSVTWRNNRLYIAHRDAGVLSSADGSGNLRSEATGLMRPGGVDVAADGTLFAGRYGTSGDAETVLSQPFHMFYDTGGIEQVNPATKQVQQIPRLLRPSSVDIAGLNDGTTFILTSTSASPASHQNALVMFENLGNGSNRNRTLKVFDTVPRRLMRDATGDHLFVTVTGEGSVYRFKRNGANWIETKINGFVAPLAMAYDAANNHLYVMDDGKIKRVSSATTNPALDAWEVTPPAPALTDIGFGNSRLYLASNNTTIRELNVSTMAITNYLTGADYNISHVMVRPNGELLVRQGGSRFFYIDSSKVFYNEALHSPGATALNIRPDGGVLYAIASYAFLVTSPRLSALFQSHEVAVDGDRVYIGSFMNNGNSYSGIHRYDRGDGSEMHIRGFGSKGVGALAVHSNRTVYAGTTTGQIYTVDGNGTATLWASLPNTVIYGLDITAANDKLWAIGANRSLYEVTLSNQAVSTVTAGLSSPRF